MVFTYHDYACPVATHTRKGIETWSFLFIIIFYIVATHTRKGIETDQNTFVNYDGDVATHTRKGIETG